MPQEITFPAGLPGFPGKRSFSVEQSPDVPLARLVPMDEDGPNFLVLTSPSLCFPDLVPFELDQQAADALGGPGQDDLVAWLILTVKPGKVTANLLGPVVVNTANGRAVQVVRDDPALPVAAPIVAREPVCSS